MMKISIFSGSSNDNKLHFHLHWNRKCEGKAEKWDSKYSEHNFINVVMTTIIKIHKYSK